MQLSLRGIRKRFDDVLALDGVDLRVQSGSTLVLLGPSGCGKSSLLRVILGLVTPDAGQLEVDGNAWPMSDAARLRARTGYVIQGGGLFPHLSARDNVTLMARHLGRPQAAIAARVRELAQLVQLDDGLLDRYLGQLSGGQLQRVSLMRALMLDPDLLLLDEPLGALDPITRADLQRDLRAIFAQLDKAVVLVTHDLAEAALLGDRIALMHAGRFLQEGSMRELLDAPADPYVERFVRAQRGLSDLLDGQREAGQG